METGGIFILHPRAERIIIIHRKFNDMRGIRNVKNTFKTCKGV